jgi:hypothetical protein
VIPAGVRAKAATPITIIWTGLLPVVPERET